MTNNDHKFVFEINYAFSEPDKVGKVLQSYFFLNNSPQIQNFSDK